jgi:predicted nucleic acid-binding protein
VKRWVCDTGPLLHLHQAGLLELLPGMGQISTSPAVANEWRRLAPDVAHVAWPSWLSEETLSRNALAVAENWVKAGLLDSGEAEALALAKERDSNGFATDDAAAREMAVALGFDVSGSLGVILSAAARGAMGAAEAFDALERLRNNSTLWLSAKVRNEAHIALERIVQARGGQIQ